MTTSSALQGQLPPQFLWPSLLPQHSLYSSGARVTSQELKSSSSPAQKFPIASHLIWTPYHGLRCLDGLALPTCLKSSLLWSLWLLLFLTNSKLASACYCLSGKLSPQTLTRLNHSVLSPTVTSLEGPWLTPLSPPFPYSAQSFFRAHYYLKSHDIFIHLQFASPTRM